MARHRRNQLLPCLPPINRHWPPIHSFFFSAPPPPHLRDAMLLPPLPTRLRPHLISPSFCGRGGGTITSPPPLLTPSSLSITATIPLGGSDAILLPPLPTRLRPHLISPSFCGRGGGGTITSPPPLLAPSSPTPSSPPATTASRGRREPRGFLAEAPNSLLLQQVGRFRHLPAGGYFFYFIGGGRSGMG